VIVGRAATRPLRITGPAPRGPVRSAATDPLRR
jgi:hypothetical protein